MKRINVIVLLLIVLSLIVACGETGDKKTGSANTKPDIPRIDIDTDGFVIDTTGKMSDATEEELERILREMFDQGFEVVVAVFSNTPGDVVLLGTDIMNENGVGDKDEADGLVIVLLMDAEGGDGHAPSIGVATGDGLRRTFTDGRVGRMLDETFVPKRADGKWEEGLIEFVVTYRALRDGSQNIENFDEEPVDLGVSILIVIIGIIVVIGILFLLGLLGAFAGGSGGSGGSWSSGSSRSSWTSGRSSGSSFGGGFGSGGGVSR